MNSFHLENNIFLRLIRFNWWFWMDSEQFSCNLEVKIRSIRFSLIFFFWRFSDDLCVNRLESGWWWFSPLTEMFAAELPLNCHRLRLCCRGCCYVTNEPPPPLVIQSIIPSNLMPNQIKVTELATKIASGQCQVDNVLLDGLDIVKVQSSPIESFSGFPAKPPTQQKMMKNAATAFIHFNFNLFIEI